MKPVVVVVGFGELVAEEVEDAAGQVELTGDAEVEQVVGEEVDGESGGAVDVGGCDQEAVVDEAIEEQVEDAAGHHGQAGALDGVDVAGEEATAEGAIVDDGEMEEAGVGGEEEVGEAVAEGFGVAGVFEFVHVDDETEHDEGGEDGPDQVGDG